MPTYFSNHAFSIYESAFGPLGKSAQFDIARLLHDLCVRALETCGRLHEASSLAPREPAGDTLAEDERIARFSRMLARAERLAASEAAPELEVRHLLQASFDELDAAPSASIVTENFVATTCAELRARAFEQNVGIDRVAVRYEVVCTGTDVDDYGNDYETFPDAVRAMRHLQRRAGMRPQVEETNDATYVFILIPANVEAVSNVVIQAREATS